MADLLHEIAGTPAGERVALILVLIAAFSHALVGAMQKGRHDPWLSRGAIDFCYGLMAAPFALVVFPWPEPHLWPILGGVFVFHLGYKLSQAAAYARGSYTVVYPVVRGTGPLITVIVSWFFFAERYAPTQWCGIAMLLGGIFGLAIYNLIHWPIDRATLRPALALATLTGGFVALYTTWDAYGIRASTNPFTFLAWLFFIDGITVMPWIALRRWLRMPERPAPGGLFLRGIIGGVVAVVSFGSVMVATLIDKVGEAAVLRETSTVFAALIGWLLLKENVGPRRLGLMALIATGAVLVERGG